MGERAISVPAPRKDVLWQIMAQSGTDRPEIEE